MKKVIKFRINTFIVVLITAILTIWIYSAFFKKGNTVPENLNNVEKTTVPTINKDFIEERMFPILLAALITFLFVDRWRRTETEIDNINKTQREAIKDIKDEAKELIDSSIESTKSKAETIESKISDLINEHPWITSVTENEIIPDAPSARVVLRTIENLYEEGSITLIYEYLYNWLENEDNKKHLLGTYDDFMDLSTFSERKLSDDYLSLRFVEYGYGYSTNKKRFLPNLVVKQIRLGNIGTAYKNIKTLKLNLHITRFSKLKAIFLYDNYSNNQRFRLESFGALALYESFRGREKTTKFYISEMEKIAANLHSKDFSQLLIAEINIINGNHDEANKILNAILNSKYDDDCAFESIRLCNLLNNDLSSKFEERFTNITTKNSNSSPKENNVNDKSTRFTKDNSNDLINNAKKNNINGPELKL